MSGIYKDEHAPATRLSIKIPTELLLDPTLSLAAKAAYGALSVMPGASLGEIARKLGADRKTLARHVEQLARKDWVERIGVSRDTKLYVVESKIVQYEEIRRFKETLAVTPYKGECLTRKWLDVEIDRDDYIDNARPDFLINPVTGKPMEYDRLYPPDRAYEHNGLQHYGPTAKYPDPQQAKEQEARDLMKEAISARHGVRLITVTWEDLSHEKMSTLIPADMPRRLVRPGDQFIKFLEQESDEYRKSMEKLARQQGYAAVRR